ncbi:BTB/POZ and MATH domain-containing protein 2-like [Aegilops tauschii subsp. strangulata]|uniref:Speckle-type POZ protein-like protein n=1 Tax=Aegilops tauschii TaxID=37682 RepID=N1QXM4_AEGTA
MEFGTTVSTCNATLVRGNHIFVVDDYSVIKETDIGKFVRSDAFQVGGYDWSVRFYPQGINDGCQDHISIVGELMNEDVEVRAIFYYRLISPGGQCTEWKQMRVLNLSSAEGKCRMGGWEKVMEKTLLEAEYVKFDHFSIEFSVSVIKDPVVTSSDLLLSPQVKLPPSQLSSDFANILESKEGADVTFCVQGEPFLAHRVVLAVRSPVFRAQLCGPMMEKEGSSLILEDMLPDVFRTLLQFIYTDCLVLPFDDFDDEDRREIVRHLLVAADRYRIERLKLICEAALSRCLDAQTVATTYALADQHQCNDLKQACLKFMASPTIFGKVLASQDYNNLKRKSPSTTLEILESIYKFPKIYAKQAKPAGQYDADERTIPRSFAPAQPGNEKGESWRWNSDKQSSPATAAGGRQAVDFVGKSAISSR